MVFERPGGHSYGYGGVGGVPWPGPIPFTFGTPLQMGYEIFAVPGSDGPSRASNDADLSFQVYDASGNRVDAQFYSAEFGRLFAPDQFVPEPSPGISVASAILLLSFAGAVRARRDCD